MKDTNLKDFERNDSSILALMLCSSNFDSVIISFAQVHFFNDIPYTFFIITQFFWSGLWSIKL